MRTKKLRFKDCLCKCIFTEKQAGILLLIYNWFQNNYAFSFRIELICNIGKYSKKKGRALFIGLTQNYCTLNKSY